MSSVASLMALLQTPSGRRFFKYCSVSALNVVLGQAMLFFFGTTLSWRPWVANLAAIVIGTGAAYLFSRRWVWEKTGKHSFSGEVLPFWGLNAAGIVLSTLFVTVAHNMWGTGLVLNAASIAAWGIVWVVKYFLLDRAVFGKQEAAVTG